MIDPTWLIIGFFFVTMLFLVFIGAFVYDVRHTLKENLNTSKETQKSSQGMWYISHDLKSALEGVRFELQQQNKFIKKRDGVIISGPLPETGPVAIPPGKSTGRSKKEKQAVPVEAASADMRYADTVTSLPAIGRDTESAR